MFGPNKSFSIKQDITFHHREPKFMQLYEELNTLFREKFSISEKFLILPITGSGTLVIEMFINSFTAPLHLVGKEGEFKNRWGKMLKYHQKFGKKGDNIFFSQLETSNSTINREEQPFFVDAVSSFPYYKIPKGTKAWATVSSKQLGGAPVLGILVLEQDILTQLIDEENFTYLNINRFLKYAKINQTHHTPSISLYVDLLEKLKTFDEDAERKNIDKNCEILIDAIGEKNITGEKYCPVITLKPNVLSEEVIYKYNLYGSHVKGHDIQIFTYAEKQEKYENLARDIKKNNK